MVSEHKKNGYHLQKEIKYLLMTEPTVVDIPPPVAPSWATGGDKTVSINPNDIDKTYTLDFPLYNKEYIIAPLEIFHTALYNSFPNKKLPDDWKAIETKGSGNQWYQPGDILFGDYCIEAKQRKLSSTNKVAILLEWITKNEEEAKYYGKTPLFILRPTGTESMFFIIGKNTWATLIRKEQ